MHRFYCPNPDSLTLDEDESHHALQVLRLSPGDLATVFDGRGHEAKVRLVEPHGRSVRFEILARQTSPAPAFTLSLGQAVPKNKAMDWIVQKTTELGLHAIWPILSDRTVIQVDGERGDAKQHKWQQTALEACKQCGQNRLPVIHPCLSTTDFLAQSGQPQLKLIASLQPDARPLHQILDEARAHGPIREVLYLIGPEGDFTPSEIGKARSTGYLPVSLGPNILRSETAALYLASVLLHELNRP
jgi:16S rRNA (uracil1498-N3)-methyltransferase